MHMNTNKENIKIDKISELLRKAPTDDGTFYGALYDLYVFIGIVQGVNSINNNERMTIEESKERMIKKYENYNTRYGSWFYW